jgi:uncharacterized membrane protein YbhN (UPF0104 family)
VAIAGDAQRSVRDPSPAATERAHSRQLRNGVISLLLMAALVAGLVLAVPGLEGVALALRHVDIDVVVVAVGLELASCLGYVLVFQGIFYEAPRRFAARLAWSEMAFGAALSFGGAGSLAVGAWVLKARGMPPGRIAERSAVLFLLTSAVNVIVLVTFGVLLGLGILPGATDPLLTFLPAGVGAAVLAVFLAIPPWADRAAHDTSHNRFATLLLGAAQSIRETRHALVRPHWRLLGAYAYLLCDIAVLYVCLRAIGQATPVAGVVLAYQIGYLANILPIPGGLGVLDSGLVGMLVLYGAKATSATAAVLAYHAIALWVPTVVGAAAFLMLRRSLTQPLETTAVARVGASVSVGADERA